MTIIDDEDFYQAKKCLEAPSKRLTRRHGKGNKSNAAEALTDAEVSFYTKNSYTDQVFKKLAECLISDGIKT